MLLGIIEATTRPRKPLLLTNKFELSLFKRAEMLITRPVIPVRARMTVRVTEPNAEAGARIVAPAVRRQSAIPQMSPQPISRPFARVSDNETAASRFHLLLRAITARRVRFTPKSGNVQCTSVCPLYAKTGHFATEKRLSNAYRNG